MWTESSRRGFSLIDLARWMAEAPTKLAGCSGRKGRIAEGYDADFAIFEPEADFVVTEDRLYYRHPLSPYLGETLRGVVKQRTCAGKWCSAAGSLLRKRQGGDHLTTIA